MSVSDFSSGFLSLCAFSRSVNQARVRVNVNVNLRVRVRINVNVDVN